MECQGEEMTVVNEHPHRLKIGLFIEEKKEFTQSKRILLPVQLC